MVSSPPVHPATSRDLSDHQNDLARVVQDNATQLASELADTSLLHEVSSELIGEVESGVLYDKIVDAAIAIMRWMRARCFPRSGMKAGRMLGSSMVTRFGASRAISAS